VDALIPTVSVVEIFLRTVVVYVAVLGLLRLAGKRELGQMSAADLVVILVIANAVQNAMNGGDNSLTGGIVAAATLVGMNYFLGRFGRRVPFIGHFVVENPTLLLQDGKVIEDHLEREHVEEDEIAMAAREHGISDLRDVSAAILEVDGSISIIPREGGRVHRARRHLRQFRQR
jgi:uncharacterized membrane protein YcaP (DUF421 family)